MRKREKGTAIFAAILLFSGLILISSSQIYYTKQVETSAEDGIEYSVYAKGNDFIANGTSLTRWYNYGENISLELETRVGWPNIPDLLPPINFTITAPSGNKTVLRYWLTPISYPYGFLVTDEINILKIGGLIPDNSSKTKFIGEPTEVGNYTLLYTTSYLPIKYLAFTKRTLEKEYLYTFMLPFGVVFIIIGAILALRVVKSLHHLRPGEKCG